MLTKEMILDKDQLEDVEILCSSSRMVKLSSLFYFILKQRSEKE